MIKTKEQKEKDKIYLRNWRLENKDRVLEHSRRYSKKWLYPYKRQQRLKAINYLGSVCKVCGIDKNLEFDHIDRKTKSYCISNIYHYRWENVIKELDKCQLLCKKHHRLKSSMELKKPITHGKASSYSNRKCRCELCTNAWADYHYKYINKK